MSSDEIYSLGLFTAGLQPLQASGIMSVAQTAGAAGNSHFLPARRYASAGYRDRNVSVRLSVTRRYCVKTKKACGMISSPSGSPKTLVFWRQISSPNSKGFPSNGGLKHGSVGKIQRFFLALSVYISKTVADTAKVTISD